MKNHQTKSILVALLIGFLLVASSLSTNAQGAVPPAAPAPAPAPARDPNLVSLENKLAQVKNDLLQLRLLVSAPAPALDLHVLGADLTALAATLHMLSRDISSAANRTAAINAFISQTRFHSDLVGVAPGAADANINAMLLGYNFKQPLDEIALVQDDLKNMTDFSGDTSTLSKHINALYWSLQRLGAGLPFAGQAKVTGPLSSGTNDSWGKIFFWTGARLQNPYSITVSNNIGTLKSGNTKTDGFVSLESNLRYIFRNGKYEDEYFLGIPENHKLGDVNFYWPFASLVPDIDFNVDYVFTGTTAPSNYNASNIAQGADISLYSTVGAPIMRYKPTGYLDTNSMKIQITVPEIGGGMTTDKGFLAVHPNLFVGAGFQMAAPTAGFYWMGRLGYARVDEPRLTTGSTVLVDGLGTPQFQWKGALTLGSSVIYKVTDSISVKLAGDVYTTHVGSWSVTAAVSIDPTKFFQSLK